MDVAQHNVNSALSAILASTASIVTLTGIGDPSDVNYMAAGAAVTTMLATRCIKHVVLMGYLVVQLT